MSTRRQSIPLLIWLFLTWCVIAVNATEITWRESIKSELSPAGDAVNRSKILQTANSTLSLKSARWRCRLRHQITSGALSDDTPLQIWRATAQITLPNGSSLIAGHLAMRWGAGSLLPALETKALTNAAEPLLRQSGASPVRTSTAWNGWSDRGVCLEKCAGRLAAGLWHREPDRGGWLSRDGWGLLVAQIGPTGSRVAAGRRPGSGWFWSGRYGTVDAAPTISSARCLIELSGPIARNVSVSQSVFAIGGAWQTGASMALGQLSGWFRYFDPLVWNDTPDGRRHQQDSGWALAWAPPGIRGSKLRLIQRRQDRPSTVIPTLERQLRLDLAAELWSGCQVKLNLSGRRKSHCQTDPGDQTQTIVVQSNRSLIDLQIRIRLDPQLDWTIRHREAGGDTRLEPAEVPQELIAIREPADQVPPAVAVNTGEVSEQELIPASWWAEETGGVTWVRLCWRQRGGWYGGLTLAATPEKTGGAAAVPIRLPPAAAYWQTVGGSRRFIELWWGRSHNQWRLEGAVRYQADSDGGDERFTVQIGFQKRFSVNSRLRESTDEATMPPDSVTRTAAAHLRAGGPIGKE